MSAEKVILALDGMGGDHAPEVVINGADAKTARDFINNSEDLSQSVKQQMLQAIGL